ncbi:hypothetical protein AURANDRAFT_62316 [Aureococcus anophagefferens]|uniref:Uncharacterized protein n=1 Tax=Aureococcus anophagefferens TaxID=44056 RepID=F0Y1E7_AURAN|nr:hypothetical protein AURANDRAFT_62316 [Aureococcus anophagefferens]EGB10952.1 hypothetical protein AURANDRAFT_62316 [Aureococcus anophagefferens]|eukprot:XP_009034520.1 hypothetical protein AURANDRAFT_62316 [Aureococcus anophagefferens]
MPLTFTEGENGYLAGWWTTRVVAYLPTFPPPQLEGSALYPLWCLYRGRMLAQNHVEYALPLGEARRLLRVAREAYPRAPVLDLYAGRCRPWPLAGANASLPDSYAAPCPRLGRAAGDGARDVAWAPDWAADTRFALEHLEDVMLYWFEDRQDPDGSFGGGWGDDVEAWRKFKALLLGFDFYRYKAGWERVSRSVHGKSSMRRGYSDHMSDVEHSAEPSADTVWPMQLINWGASYDDDSANAWRTIAARIGALQDAHWLVERETKSGAKTHVVENLMHALQAAATIHEDPFYMLPFLSMTATLNAVYNGTYAGPEDEGSAKWAALELESAVQSTLKVADALGLLGFVPPDVKHYYETHGRPSGYEAYRLGFDDAWDGTGEFRDYFSYDEAAFTTEVRFTDRIFSFHGAWRAALGDDERYRSGKRDYKPDKLYMAVTGDVVAPNTLPVRAVVWRTRAADLGVIVCPLPRVARTPRGQTSFVAKLFHFGESPRPMGAVLHELADGSYSWFVISNGTFVDVAISAAGGLDNATKLEAAAQDMAFGPGVLVEASGSLDVARPRAATPLDFVLPPRVAVELGVFRVGR